MLLQSDVRTELFPHKSSILGQRICNYRDKDLLWLFMSTSFFGLPLLCGNLHRPISLPVCLRLFILFCLLSFGSFFSTNQYAGQQAVWQIVCCELHEKPLSIVLVLYWIQSVVFSCVKRKRFRMWGGWIEAEARSPFFSFCASTATSQLSQKHNFFEWFSFTIQGNSVY